MENQEEYYKAILGPKNQDYYLQQFARFDDDGKAGPSWHWPAFFITFYWFLYRKMWMPALAYFFLPSLYMIALGILAAVMGPALGSILSILGYLAYFGAIFVVLPMYANALYYLQCKKKIAEVQASGQPEQRQLGELAGKGGTSGAALFIVFILVFVAIIGILAAIAIPAYVDYTTRAQTTSAVTLGNKAAQKVGDYYSQHQNVPISLSEAGFSEPIATYVREIAMNSQNGVITITMASGPVSGKSLMLIPSVDANHQVVWQCRSEEILERYLPPPCRQPK